MAGVAMGDSNSGGTIPMAINGGGAMDGRRAATSAIAIAMNGGGSKEGDGDGDEGGGRATATAMKRAMATAMRVASD